MRPYPEHPTIQSAGARLGQAIERQFEFFLRSHLRGEHCTLAPGFVRFQTGEMHPFANFAAIRESTDIASLHDAIAPLCRSGAPSAVIVPGAIDPPLLTLLTSEGYEVAEPMPAMAVDLDGVAEISLPAGYSFEEIGPDRDGPWCDAMARGYGIPRTSADQMGPSAMSEARVGEGSRSFAIVKGGEIVATSAMFLAGGLAGIYCVATLEQERGKGLGGAATALPLALARSLGYRTGILQASRMGESVYRRLGFETFGGLTLFARMPQA